MDALGRLIDIGLGAAPIDMNSGDGLTGKRHAMSGSNAVSIVVLLGAAASGTDDVTIDVQQHTAYTSGTSQDLDPTGATGSVGVTYYYIKSETLLDNDEAWTKVTQAEASEVVLAGASLADKQCIVVIEVEASQLAAGYTHISANVAYATNAVRVGAILYLPHELRYQRKPANLRNLLRPSAVNA